MNFWVLLAAPACGLIAAPLRASASSSPPRCAAARCAVEANVVEAKVVLPNPPGPLRRIGTRVRTAYGAYAARCDEDACSIDSYQIGLLARPVRWVRALLPKPRPLSRLNLCEGGTFKVLRDGDERKMIFQEDKTKADTTCSIDML